MGAWNPLQYLFFVIIAIPYYAVMAPLLMLSWTGLRISDAIGRCLTRGRVRRCAARGCAGRLLVPSGRAYRS